MPNLKFLAFQNGVPYPPLFSSAVLQGVYGEATKALWEET